MATQTGSTYVSESMTLTFQRQIWSLPFATHGGSKKVLATANDCGKDNVRQPEIARLVAMRKQTHLRMGGVGIFAVWGQRGAQTRA